VPKVWAPHLVSQMEFSRPNFPWYSIIPIYVLFWGAPTLSTFPQFFYFPWFNSTSSFYISMFHIIHCQMPRRRRVWWKFLPKKTRLLSQRRWPGATTYIGLIIMFRPQMTAKFFKCQDFFGPGAGWPDEFVNKSPNFQEKNIGQNYFVTFTVEKVAEKFEPDRCFKTALRKQSPNGRKFAPSGHPDPERHVPLFFFNGRQTKD
jgi:hypothetical protein